MILKTILIFTALIILGTSLRMHHDNQVIQLDDQTFDNIFYGLQEERAILYFPITTSVKYVFMYSS